MTFDGLKKADLVELCEYHGLSTEGTKSDLIRRLTHRSADERGWKDEEPPSEAVEPPSEAVVASEGADTPSEEESGSNRVYSEPEQFIMDSYQKILGREPSEGRFNHYRMALLIGQMDREKIVEILNARKKAESL